MSACLMNSARIRDGTLKQEALAQVMTEAQNWYYSCEYENCRASTLTMRWTLSWRTA